MKKLIFKKADALGGYALYDEDGLLLPMQAKTCLVTDANELPKILVEFILDHENIVVE